MLSNLMGLFSKTENLNEQPAGQFSNSIFHIFIAALVLYFPAYIGFTYLATTYLPPTQSLKAAELINKVFDAAATAIFGGGPLALFVRSILLTNGKIQKAKQTADIIADKAMNAAHTMNTARSVLPIAASLGVRTTGIEEALNNLNALRSEVDKLSKSNTNNIEDSKTNFLASQYAGDIPPESEALETNEPDLTDPDLELTPEEILSRENQIAQFVMEQEKMARAQN